MHAYQPRHTPRENLLSGATYAKNPSRTVGAGASTRKSAPPVGAPLATAGHSFLAVGCSNVPSAPAPLHMRDPNSETTPPAAVCAGSIMFGHEGLRHVAPPTAYTVPSTPRVHGVARVASAGAARADGMRAVLRPDTTVATTTHDGASSLPHERSAQRLHVAPPARPPSQATVGTLLDLGGAGPAHDGHAALASARGRRLPPVAAQLKSAVAALIAQRGKGASAFWTSQIRSNGNRGALTVDELAEQLAVLTGLAAVGPDDVRDALWGTHVGTPYVVPFQDFAAAFAGPGS